MRIFFDLLAVFIYLPAKLNKLKSHSVLVFLYAELTVSLLRNKSHHLFHETLIPYAAQSFFQIFHILSKMTGQ